MKRKPKLVLRPWIDSATGFRCFAGPTLSGVWRAWNPDNPHLYGEGESQIEAARHLQAQLQTELDHVVSQLPDAPVTKQEAATFAAMGFEARAAKRGGFVDYAQTILRETVRGESERTVFIPRVGNADTFRKWTRLSSKQFDSLAKHKGEAQAVTAAFSNMVDLLVMVARAGNPDYISALFTIGSLAARGLESARAVQPEKVKEFSRKVECWPLFFSPHTGQDLDEFARITAALEIGAMSPFGKSGKRASSTGNQKAHDDFSALCTCIYYGMVNARAFSRSSFSDAMSERIPWLRDAASLIPIPPGGNPNVAAQWFEVGWKALLWAFDGEPENYGPLAEHIARRKEHGTGRYGSPQGILRERLKPEWLKKFGGPNHGHQSQVIDLPKFPPASMAG